MNTATSPVTAAQATAPSTYSERVAELLPVFNRIANYLPCDAGALEPEDLAQEMAADLLSKESKMTGQPTGYLVASARNAGLHAARKGFDYRKYVKADSAIPGAEEDDDLDGYERVEMVRDPVLSPEKTVEEQEHFESILKIVASLSAINQKVVIMMAQGCSCGEIAKTLKISNSAVTQRKETIRRALVDGLKE